MKGQVPNMGIYAPWCIYAMHPYLKRLYGQGKFIFLVQ